MKKKSLAILIVIALVLIFVLAGCSGIKTNKDYYLYSFEFEKGTFVQNLAKISFDKDTYTSYDNTGTVDDIGEYLIEDSVISLVPDKIGDANRIARTANMYLYDTYIIDPTLISSRITLTQFGDREKIEGLYDAGFYLKDGKIYDSYDGSNIIESYTEKVGEYKFNKNKDFINIEMDDGTKDCLLTFTYTDNLGQETRAFAPVFYSHKNPKVEAMKDAVVQMYTQVFENKSSDGSSANYELKLISFPDKNVFNNNVSFEIVGANPNATDRKSVV